MLVPSIIERWNQGAVVGYDIFSRLLKDRIIFVGGSGGAVSDIDGPYLGGLTPDNAGSVWCVLGALRLHCRFSCALPAAPTVPRGAKRGVEAVSRSTRTFFIALEVLLALGLVARSVLAEPNQAGGEPSWGCGLGRDQNGVSCN